MLIDASLPSAFRTRPDHAPSSATLHGQRYASHSFTSDQIVELAEHLQRSQKSLEALTDQHLLMVWSETIETLLDRASSKRRQLDEALRLSSGLSKEGLDAALSTLLRGVDRQAAETILAGPRPAITPGFAWIILASNLPALAVQTLLPALVLRRPIWFKNPTSKPWFTPFLIEMLAEKEPVFREAFIATTWAGGHRDLEDPLVERAAKVIAYGGGAAIADLQERAGGKLVAHGPKASLAIFDNTIDPEQVAPLVARDIALFDQQGCLSIQAIYTNGAIKVWAAALAKALREIAKELPAGTVRPELASRVQQERALAHMRQLEQPTLELEHGTVIVEGPLEANASAQAFQPSPGLRTVRIYPIRNLDLLPDRLRPWKGQIQGVVLAGDKADRLKESLKVLGVSRIAGPGQLQQVEATWENGGIRPLEALS